MKYFFTLIWMIICVVVLFFGHHFWNERTAVTPAAAKQAIPSVVQAAAKSAAPTNDDLISKSQNWPKTAQEQFQQALKQNHPFKILFVGSAALGTKDQGMLKDVIQGLTAAYGSHIEMSSHTYDVSSNQFLLNHDQVEMAAEKAQLIVLEPFLLNDNGKVAIDESLNNLTKVIGDVNASNPNTTFILQPSYPLFGAKFYPGQVARLKQYAAQHGLTYLDHWTAWPDTASADLKNYLLPDQSGPSDKGNQVWSQYLLHYLVHK
jgi:hypothetical protein